MITISTGCNIARVEIMKCNSAGALCSAFTLAGLSVTSDNKIKIDQTILD
jgi:hypothetical protein